MTESYPKLQLFIGGEWLGPDGRVTEPVMDPARNQPLAELPHASKADLDRALEAAQKAQVIWGGMSPYERSGILRNAASIMRSRLDTIARVLTLEEGKSLGESRLEVSSAIEIFEWMAEEGRRAYGRLIPARQAGWRQMVIKEPVGVVAAFTPWNFPALTPARKIAGSLGAGCACIIKPSEETPGTALELARALHEAGLPAGALNVVFGVPSEVSEYLIASPVIKKISFTGSTAVGKHLGKLAAAGVKRATMELGGHGPVLVFDDIDVDYASKMAAASKFRNAGQVCVSPTRFFVHERVYEKFVGKFVEHAEALKVGPGIDAGTTMGPLANMRRVEAMDMFVADAHAKGARVRTGGARMGNAGFFWQPTVLTDLSADARVLTEEPFGALALMIPFSNDDEAVNRANSLPYGLAAYVFTTDPDRQVRCASELQSGLIGMNTFAITTPETPFGGMKESGYGHEGGIEGLDAYLSTKFVSQAPVRPR